ncbi:methionyl-tRNA formyltransferase [Nitrosophilus alvini]|uniref:methionyl-tRNA formyltransferase n=1 Tax=Nitrosophilus alvini TaxID=2714855 RepID=UPI00190DD3C1|nr:methionyl-tRNA formyltransferase [Nitrosophilus alvini]
MRIVFMGTPDYATKILKKLFEMPDMDVAAVFTQPDKPVGRKKILTPPDVKKFLLQAHPGMKIYQPHSLKGDNSEEILKDISPDFIVVAAYGQILPKNILDIAPCINLHASLLPKYRGASPIQQALLNSDEITGVTAMLMDEGLDTGDILAYRYEKIGEEDNALTLFEKLSECAAELTPTVLRNFDEIKPLSQNDVDASYCKKINKSDGLVSFDSALDIYNRYRAFISWPGIYTNSGLKLKKIRLVETESQNRPGVILDISDNEAVIGCKKGTISVITVQPPSKKEMDIASFIRGRRLKVGDCLV